MHCREGIIAKSAALRSFAKSVVFCYLWLCLCNQRLFIAFAAVYGIVSRSSAYHHFRIGDEYRSLTFFKSLYFFSVVALATVSIKVRIAGLLVQPEASSHSLRSTLSSENCL